MAGLGAAEAIPDHEASLWRTRLIPPVKARWIRGGMLSEARGPLVIHREKSQHQDEDA